MYGKKRYIKAPNFTLKKRMKVINSQNRAYKQ